MGFKLKGLIERILSPNIDDHELAFAAQTDIVIEP